MIGPAPDLGGNVTVMPLCADCGGAQSKSPQDFADVWPRSTPVGTPVEVCPTDQCGCQSGSCPANVTTKPVADNPWKLAF